MMFQNTALSLSVVLMSGCQANLKQVDFMDWKKGAELPSAHEKERSIGVAGPVAGVYKDYLLVAGGANFPDAFPWHGGKKAYHDDAYLFQKEGDRLHIYDSLFKIPETRAYAAVCSSPVGIIVAGGENVSGISAKASLISWSSNPASLKIDSLPELPMALTNASAVAIGVKIYLAGGETAETSSDRLFCLDMNQRSKGWMSLQPIPSPVSHAVFVYNESHSKIYLAGGRRKNANGISTFYSTLYSYDPERDRWDEEHSLPYALSAGTGFSKGDQIVLTGGDKGIVFNNTERLIAAINVEQDEKLRLKLTEEKNKLQASHPGFSKEILIYHISEQRWEKAGNLPFDTPVTTTALQMGDEIILPSGEIKAGIRTPNIMIGRMNNSKTH